MTPFAVQAEDLSKVYTIGQLEGGFRFARRMLMRRDDRVVKWALRDVSFTVEEGQAVAIVGRNGAGKSTLLKVLSRITEPTSGYADIRGRVGALLEVGTGFHPELTGRENVYLNGSILGMQRQEVARKFSDIVDFAGVGAFIDTPVKRYSSGMYVRLAFGVAAFLEPEILIVDEVLSVGDAEFQKRCLGRMSEVARDGRTVLFVSHNLSAVRRLCSHAVLLEHGEVALEGDVETVVRHYLASVDDTSAGERDWEPGSGPGNEIFTFVRVSVTNGSGAPATTFLSSEPIIVTLEFETSDPHPALSVGFDLSAFDASVVFRSAQVDMPERSRPKIRKGHNTLSCTIPPALLNNGRYGINLRAVMEGIRSLVWEDDVLQFDVIADHGESLYLNQQGRPGVISPILAWNEGTALEAAAAPAAATSSQ
jgi:lipopolysaccharide transport system ATP-binding protein